MKPIVEVLYFDGCPHAPPTFDMVDEVTASLTTDARATRVPVETPDRATELGFLGSPSVRIDGTDVEGRDSDAPSFCCRVYEGGGGIPPRWMVEAAILRALAPESILFLCVANSARSQMAEGIARHLLGDAIRVQSAGSAPTQVRPEAIKVLSEIGVDITDQRSKSVDTIEAASVDTVITLCAEEICPAFLGGTRHLHWGLVDPAAATSSGADRLQPFRDTRDELRRRIARLAPGARQAVQGGR